MNDEWIKISCQSDMPNQRPFLLLDEHGSVHVGYTAFDFYDSDYWYPMPKFPSTEGIITNDQCISLLLKDTP